MRETLGVGRARCDRSIMGYPDVVGFRHNGHQNGHQLDGNIVPAPRPPERHSDQRGN